MRHGHAARAGSSQGARRSSTLLAMRRGALRVVAYAILWCSVVGAAASASAIEREPLPFEPYTATGPATCTPDGPLGAVESEAWAEIERLGDLGLPVCDVVWVFWRGDDGTDSVGRAVPRHSDEDPRPAVWIETDINHHVIPGPEGVDAKDLARFVRSLVRHEVAHALTYMLGADGLERDEEVLRELFPGPLDAEAKFPGLEAAGEAIAAELTPASEVRWWIYDKDIAPVNAANARAMLDLIVLRPS